MDLRPLSDAVRVTPQLLPEHMAQLAVEGVELVICNRPDAENPPDLQAAAMQKAAEAAGLGFVYNPVIGSAMTRDNVEEQAEALAGATGPVVAYCASGTRSAVMWSLAMAGTLPTDEILGAVGRAGYALDHLRPQIEALASERNGG